MRSLQFKNKNNRTPTISSRSRMPMTAYYRSRPKTENSSPFARREPKPKLRRYAFGVLDIILVIALTGGLIYSLMVSSNPAVRANDLTFHSLEDYTSAAAAQLSHFGNRNKITFDESSLAAALKKQFPEIDTVKVELPLFTQRPAITLGIDRPNFFLDSQNSRYVIDASGRAVAKSADLPKVGNLPVINDTSGFSISTGRQVLSTDGVAFINSLIAQCRHSGIQIDTLSLPAVPQELDLKAKGQNYFVKFFLGGDVLTQTGQYFAARHHFNQTGQQPSQYLDVRVQGKVFYK